MGTFNARRVMGLHNRTYEALGSVVIPGGKLVISAAGATSDPTLPGMNLAGDAAVTVVGVTEHDSIPTSLRAQWENGSEGFDTGYPTVDVSVPGNTSTVYNDVEGYLTFTGACAEGGPICAAASGGVRAWVSGNDAEAARIGKCTQPGGVAAAGVGLAHVKIA